VALDNADDGRVVILPIGTPQDLVVKNIMLTLTLRLCVDPGRFLAAAVALIALLVVPAAALAHAGHIHSASTAAPRAVDASVPNHDLAVAISTKGSATSARAESYVGFHGDVSLDTGGPDGSRSCDGTCCAANCLACCALLPQDRFTGSLSCTRARPALLGALAADSLYPDGLGRPPKRFA
jgi:hypothetical protein